MKRRFSDGRSNKNILDRDFKHIYVEDEEFKGYISALIFKKVEKEWHVPRQGRQPDKIQANGYVWISIYPLNENNGITVMFNDKKEIVEWYFDVTYNAGIEDNVPYIDDLYLDVVITDLGEIIILDEDELEEAYENHDITKEQYELAINEKDRLVRKYTSKEEFKKLQEFSMKCYDKVMSK